MARNLSKQRQEVLAFLREKGEMKYQDLVDHLKSEGKYDHVQALPELYARHETKQRIVQAEDGMPVLMIKAGE